MEKTTIIWLCIAVSLVVLGLALFTVVMSIYHWDFTKLGTVQFETNTHPITEEFRSICIQTDTADLRFVPSEDGSCSVVCHEAVNEKHTASVQDGALMIQLHSSKKWYEYIGINFRTPRITVSLPEAAYASLVITESTGNVEIPKEFTFETMDITVSTGNVTSFASAFGPVRIRTSTGSIRLQDISAQSLELAVSTGKVAVKEATCTEAVRVTTSTGEAALTDVSCKSLSSNGSTGDIVLKNVIAQDRFSIERNTGDVVFEGCDAMELFIKTSTGDVEGTLLSEKLFLVQTNTGHVHVPKTTTGGKCEITSSTGDIELSIAELG